MLMIDYFVNSFLGSGSYAVVFGGIFLTRADILQVDCGDNVSRYMGLLLKIILYMNC